MPTMFYGDPSLHSFCQQKAKKQSAFFCYNYILETIADQSPVNTTTRPSGGRGRTDGSRQAESSLDPSPSPSTVADCRNDPSAPGHNGSEHRSNLSPYDHFGYLTQNQNVLCRCDTVKEKCRKNIKLWSILHCTYMKSIKRLSISRSWLTHIVRKLRKNRSFPWCLLN